MRRKGAILAGWLLLATLLATSGAVRAEVKVRAWVDREHVTVGQSVSLQVEARGAQNVGAPDLGTVTGLVVQYIGPSTQVSIVNGSMSASITHRFAVTPSAAGRFAIGPIRVTHEGTTYDAGTVRFEVRPVGGGGGGGPGAAPAPDAGAVQEQSPAGRQLRLTTTVPKAKVYVHERLPLTVQLWVGNVRISDLQYPTVAGDGFGIEPFPEPAQRNERTAEGVFQVLEFNTVLTPHRSGTLTIGPAQMQMSMMTGRGNDFFGAFFRSGRRPVDLRSELAALEVMPLPDAGRPAGFSGAVGRFDFQVHAAPLEVAEGDPVTLTMTVRGEGNLDGLDAPGLAGSDVLRVYPSQQTDAAADAAASTGGTVQKTFEQVVIPQRDGAFALPGVTFSYFDPAIGDYRSSTSPQVTLTVRPSANQPSAPHVVGAAPLAAPAEEKLGRDIVFIKAEPGRLHARGARLYRSAAFWALIPLPLLAWAAVIVWDRRRQRLHGDAGYARFTRAGRAARKTLADAETALRAGDQRAFYDQIATAVGDYLAAKLALPPGAVGADAVAAALGARRLDPAVIAEVRDLLTTCERVRYAPDLGAADGDSERTLARALAIVRTFERERRLAPPAAAVLALAALAALAAGVAGAAESEHPSAIFFRAGELYGAERYADAAAAYERVLAQGVESGNLYFNLGNAYFKQGDVGRAVLGYERARLLLPRDPDVAANLAYARTLSDEDAEVPLWARLLFPLAPRLTADELLTGAAIAYTTLMLLLIAARLTARGPRPLRAATIAAGVVLAVFVTSGAYRFATVELPARAVVVAPDRVAVRFEPATSGTEHFTAKPGRVLRVLDERDDWAQVARSDGKRGWVERSALAPL
jgi:tetratricopeptide (TPR) repeat protein